MAKEEIRLSVAYICRDEEANIARSIESVKEIADEIIVVDSGSRDRTLEIALACGARIFHRDFDDFASQKNFALAQCTGRWVLSLDADEEAVPELVRSIGRAISRDVQCGYYISRKTFYLGKLLRRAWTPDKVLRLARRSDSPRWEGKVHESLKIDGETSELGGILVHHSYSDLSHHMKKTVAYAKMAAESYHSRGRKFSALNLILNPAVNFIRNYFFSLWLVDGFRGFLAAWSGFVYTSLKYFFLREIELKK